MRQRLNWRLNTVPLCPGFPVPFSLPMSRFSLSHDGHTKAILRRLQGRGAREAPKQTRTLPELSMAFQVHPVQISRWKKQLLDGAESLFGDGRRHKRDQSEALQAELITFRFLELYGLV